MFVVYNEAWFVAHYDAMDPRNVWDPVTCTPGPVLQVGQ